MCSTHSCTSLDVTHCTTMQKVISVMSSLIDSIKEYIRCNVGGIVTFLKVTYQHNRDTWYINNTTVWIKWSILYTVQQHDNNWLCYIINHTDTQKENDSICVVASSHYDRPLVMFLSPSQQWNLLNGFHCRRSENLLFLPCVLNQRNTYMERVFFSRRYFPVSVFLFFFCLRTEAFSIYWLRKL